MLRVSLTQQLSVSNGWIGKHYAAFGSGGNYRMYELAGGIYHQYAFGTPDILEVAFPFVYKMDMFENNLPYSLSSLSQENANCTCTSADVAHMF